MTYARRGVQKAQQANVKTNKNFEWRRRKFRLKAWSSTLLITRPVDIEGELWNLMRYCRSTVVTARESERREVTDFISGGTVCRIKDLLGRNIYNNIYRVFQRCREPDEVKIKIAFYWLGER